jgi:hypothetical protein
MIYLALLTASDNIFYMQKEAILSNELSEGFVLPKNKEMHHYVQENHYHGLSAGNHRRQRAGVYNGSAPNQS